MALQLLSKGFHPLWLWPLYLQLFSFFFNRKAWIEDVSFRIFFLKKGVSHVLVLNVYLCIDSMQTLLGECLYFISRNKIFWLTLSASLHVSLSFSVCVYVKVSPCPLFLIQFCRFSPYHLNLILGFLLSQETDLTHVGLPWARDLYCHFDIALSTCFKGFILSS